MDDLYNQITQAITAMDLYEVTGLIFGLLAVVFLIKENILTWPSGIIYILVSLVVFWREKLYADFGLHIFFLMLNIYGWWYWVKGRKEKTEALDQGKSEDNEVLIGTISITRLIIITIISGVGIFVMGLFFETYTDASLPYWDSATTTLSITGMWLTARKKIENWYFWLIVDILATGIYYYKGIHFYAILYLIYIGLAISGYMTWKKTLGLQTS